MRYTEVIGGSVEAGAVGGSLAGDVVGPLTATVLKRSPGEWDAGVSYSAGQIVLGSDGNYYRAVASGSGADPTSDDGSSWKLWYVAVDTTLAVDITGTRFGLPSQAYAFVADASFANDAVCTISVSAPASGSITGATNASPIVVAQAGHGYATGQSVDVRDVGGNTAANSTWSITVVDADHYSLDGSTGNGAYTSGGTARRAFREAAEILIDTPYGGHIQFIGDTVSATPETVLHFYSGTGGLRVGSSVTPAGGVALGSIDGFRLVGTWDPNGAGSSGDSGYAQAAVVARGSTRLIMGSHITIDNFYFGVSSGYGAYVYAPSTRVTNGGDSGFIAIMGGVLYCPSATVDTMNSATLGFGVGFNAERGGILRCPDTSATKCRNHGYSAYGGLITADGDVSSNNNNATAGGTGIALYRGSTMYVTGSISCTGNGTGGSGDGILADGFSSLIILGTSSQVTCSGNSGYGIRARSASAVHAESETITIACGSNGNPNGLDGIYLEGGACIRCQGLNASYNAGAGITLHRGHIYVTNDLTVQHNGASGIAAAGNASLYLNGDDGSSNLDCSSNTGVGISFFESDLRVIGTLTASGGSAGGISCRNSRIRITSTLTASSNSGTGAQFEDGCSVRVDGNILCSSNTGASSTGLRVGEGSTLDCGGTITTSLNGQHGVYCYHRGYVHARTSGSTVSSNTGTGTLAEYGSGIFLKTSVTNSGNGTAATPSANGGVTTADGAQVGCWIKTNA